MKRNLWLLLLFLSLIMFPGFQAVAAAAPATQQAGLASNGRTSSIPVGMQSQDIRDIEGPVPLSDPTRYLIPAAAALAVVVIGCLLFWVWKRRRKPLPPGLPPDVQALAELEKARELMTPGTSLAYAERISDILRHYIESRFQIRSTRQTTREFFTQLKNGTTIAEVDIKNHAGDLQICLEQCDIAKFAHGLPDEGDMNQMDTAARTFIETTRQNREQAATDNQPADGRRS